MSAQQVCNVGPTMCPVPGSLTEPDDPDCDRDFWEKRTAGEPADMVDRSTALLVAELRKLPASIVERMCRHVAASLGKSSVALEELALLLASLWVVLEQITASCTGDRMDWVQETAGCCVRALAVVAASTCTGEYLNGGALDSHEAASKAARHLQWPGSAAFAADLESLEEATALPRAAPQDTVPHQVAGSFQALKILHTLFGCNRNAGLLTLVVAVLGGLDGLVSKAITFRSVGAPNCVVRNVAVVVPALLALCKGGSDGVRAALQAGLDRYNHNALRYALRCGAVFPAAAATPAASGPTKRRANEAFADGAGHGDAGGGVAKNPWAASL